MRVARSFSAFLPLLVLALCSCKSSNPANAAQASAPKPTPLTTIPTTQGGIIEYGSVAGATTLPAAMANVLSQVHQACGEKPSVGQVFRVKGSNSAGVIFTVVDHAQGNRQLAGMVIAAQTAPNQMEAAVVSDSADRFAQTANPHAAATVRRLASWPNSAGIRHIGQQWLGLDRLDRVARISRPAAHRDCA